MSSSTSKPAGASTATPSNELIPDLKTLPNNSDAEEDIISPVTAILQVSQAFPGPLVDLLTSLLQKVQTLENKVATLQAESASSANEVLSLRRQMLVVQKNTGGSFYRFPELPVELRCMVWQWSLCFPRIVAVQSDSNNVLYIGEAIRVVGPSHAELYACRESRAEALKVLCPLNYITNIDDPFTPLRYYHPDGVLWTLGNPGEDLQFAMGQFWMNLEGQPKSRTFACGWDKWNWEDASEHYEWTFMQLLDAGAQELILVIGDESFAQRGDVVFVEPTVSVKEVMPTKKSRRVIDDFLSTLTSCTKRAKDHTWVELAKHIEGIFDSTRQEYRDLRSQAIADGITEQVMESRYDEYIFQINSMEWLTPRVRFMEVSTVQEQKRLQGL